MCEIAGILGTGAADYVAAVKRMTAAMTHRGPDGEGLYVSQSEACVLGHRWLSILDLTDNAAQPMVDESRDHIMRCLPRPTGRVREPACQTSSKCHRLQPRGSSRPEQVG